ncbi:unannotated protein [freshwater metagenome]|uniref:Unannotated protein n=1 Tax=freshwater metagenome TaxID=449393 RepID=A0A6J7EST9_9ZZZZ
MGLFHAATVLASEEAAGQMSGVPSYVFGLFAFGALAVALIVTLMINVDR